ncbi:MAG: alkaline phosphatase family protein [Candidatus Marinimicrobia bacterium]|jgi:alkaline phosphatase D|nr:alkaline phosphatase family protein [Candidatus Neomarinimicrobiota bacterium]MBT3629948.1 alkaline phosphatase family protein [Candidatus Neomarinimicrobiota bacterium]MBT3825563.1 alkaline phosphatase family protein [Candidatus Neomarinimicrobiota bacterium]MBT4130989.1 alkaline phosphatase family protein [Candidatus Neomarinimicrobiota bacterium]MBT4294998.1 alkaline phosphatase family protein [Candidatus Neomarinimicrobiota bacterium]
MQTPKSIQIFAILILIVFVLIACTSNPYVKKIPKEQYVVMLSLDGCRWDYPQMANMPNLEAIAREGVKLESLQPAFPSKTFPNHYSIATGLYPDNHGIVQNTFYDPDMDAYYKIRDRDAVENGDFYGGEPIWVTAEKQGLKTGSFYWVGSEAPVSGTYPSRWKKYNHTFPYEARVDSVIAWLSLPKDQRPRLITWYYPEPDGVGHKFSPESEEVKAKLEYLDSLIGDFRHKLAQLPIANQVNVIVTSDHGMARTSGDKIIYFDDYIQPAWIDTALGSNPIWMFDAMPEYLDSVYLNLQRAEHLQVWKRDSIPDALHYGSHPRVMDIVAAPDLHWSVGWRAREYPSDYVGGTHGYDPRYKDMHAIFYASGPAFKHGYVHPTVENVNIYPLIAKILNLKPAETDGKLENVSRMLKPKMLIDD